MSQKISRRSFVKGVIATTVATALPLQASSSKVTQRVPTQELSGTEFHLTIDKTLVNVTGSPSYATAVNRLLLKPQ